MSTVLDHNHDRYRPVGLPPHPGRAGRVGAAARGGEARRAPHPVVELPIVTDDSGFPDPAPLVANLALCVVEILAGARNIDQLSRWVSDDVFIHLLRRSAIAARTRRLTGATVQRPRLLVGDPVVARPLDGVVEAVVLVHQPNRSRAVAIRLDAVGERWRASAISVL
ncbi:Rv3235 family protein [Leifsonia sp. NPDC102414]|uniref:Rv3235 family protein n=1 Tax=Leifsonia sp. NPDC102414 TaxID=3364124 RepID=UPI0037F5E1E3